MFWGSFTYDTISPCHIFIPETTAMKKAAKKEIEQLNIELEQEIKAEWELDLTTQQPPPKCKPKWRFTYTKGKLKRSGKGGIDWYKYWSVR